MLWPSWEDGTVMLVSSNEASTVLQLRLACMGDVSDARPCTLPPKLHTRKLCTARTCAKSMVSWNGFEFKCRVRFRRRSEPRRARHAGLLRASCAGAAAAARRSGRSLRSKPHSTISAGCLKSWEGHAARLRRETSLTTIYLSIYLSIFTHDFAHVFGSVPVLNRSKAEQPA